eukprot:42743_1
MTDMTDMTDLPDVDDPDGEDEPQPGSGPVDIEAMAALPDTDHLYQMTDIAALPDDDDVEHVAQPGAEGNVDESSEENDSDCVELKEWMKRSVGLEQYTEMMIHSGYRNMKDLEFMTLDDLKEMGVHKVSHKRKIYSLAQGLVHHNQETLGHLTPVRKRFSDVITYEKFID